MKRQGKALKASLARTGGLEEAVQALSGLATFQDFIPGKYKQARFQKEKKTKNIYYASLKDLKEVLASWAASLPERPLPEAFTGAFERRLPEASSLEDFSELPLKACLQDEDYFRLTVSARAPWLTFQLLPLLHGEALREEASGGRTQEGEVPPAVILRSLGQGLLAWTEAVLPLAALEVIEAQAALASTTVPEEDEA